MRKIALGLFTAFLLLSVVFFTSIYFILKNKDFQRALIPHLEKQFHNQITLDSFELSFFPPISLVLKDASLEMKWPGGSVTVTAPAAKLHLKLWPLFLRRIEIGYVQAEDTGAEVRWMAGNEQRSLKLAGWEVALNDIVLGRPVKLSLQGPFLNPDDNFQGEGSFRLASQNGSLKITALELTSSFREADLVPLAGLALEQAPDWIRSGTVSWKGSVSWREGQWSLKGPGALGQVIYAISPTAALTSSPVSLSFDLDAVTSPSTGKIVIRRLSLNSAYGNFEAKGNLPAPDSYDFEVRTADLSLDRLPELLVPLERAIPNKMGFSGQLEMNVSIRGTGGNLSVAGSAEMTQSLLSYATYFTKPKDVPLKLDFESAVDGSGAVKGNFNVRLKDMNLKGSVNRFEPKSGQADINFLTNKFSLEGWEALLAPLARYPAAGNAKVLLTLQGSFKKPEELAYAATLSLEDVKTRYEELEIRDLDGVLEFTNLRSSSGMIDVALPETKFHLEYLHQVAPHESTAVKILSPSVPVYPLLAPLGKLILQCAGEKSRPAVESFQSGLKKFMDPQSVLSNLALSFSWAEDIVSLKEASFGVYGGKFRGAGDVDLDPADPRYNLGVQIEELDLAPLFAHLTGNPLLEGRLFLLANLEGEKLDAAGLAQGLRGEGEFKVAKGRMRSLNLWAAVEPGATDVGFDDMTAAFSLKNGKIITDSLTLVSPRYRATAGGFFTLDGLLNYNATMKVTEPASEFPFQVYGDFANPKIALDQKVSDRSAA
ncbi:MAG: AsmA family protein [Candidatus Omnitrophica bacterium]|nr:AsmA family protein [Candidatus Omnitrophota bacterium]